MDRKIVSERLCSAELRPIQRRLPPTAWSASEAATEQARGSPAGLLVLLLGAWAANWGTLVSLSSWLR